MIEPTDDDERTNSLGLFNTAEAYRLSARALQAAKVRHGNADKPLRFLYYHALELYLKALLREKHSMATVAKQVWSPDQAAGARSRDARACCRRKRPHCADAHRQHRCDDRLALYQNRDKAAGYARIAPSHLQKHSRWCRHHPAQQRRASAAVIGSQHLRQQRRQHHDSGHHDHERQQDRDQLPPCLAHRNEKDAGRRG